MIRALNLLLPFSIPPRLRRHLPASPKPYPSPISSSPASKHYSTNPPPSRLLRGTVDGEHHEESAAFFDEDGAVDDMDAYLNHISLEYDSVWDTKPSWCQPWTIVLSGVAVIASSWVLLRSAVIGAGISCLIFAWWYIFLYAYPKAYANMIAERRKNVNSGIEDTFGFRNSR